jgi:hypothetical protein
MSLFPRLPCPECRSELALTRISFGVSGFELRTFECPVCDHVYKTLVALVDPMKSAETRGWLHGLRAPN